MHTLAWHVRDGTCAVVDADELQTRIDAGSSRDGVVHGHGIFADCDGARLTFVQRHVRDARERFETVRAHFRIEREERTLPSLEEGDVEDPPPHATPRDSNERFRALRLLERHVGRWGVSEWCCARKRTARVWKPPAGAVAQVRGPVLLPGVGRGAGTAALTVHAGHELALAVDLSKNDRHALLPTRCRLSPVSVVETLQRDGEHGALCILVNLDCPTHTCAECMAADSRVAQEERERGRVGVRARVRLERAGLRVPLVPGDLVRVARSHKGARVPIGLVREGHGTRVGSLPATALSHVPNGWKVRLDVLHPHPYEVPVHVRWKADSA